VGQRAWEEDASTTRLFIHELIAKENGWSPRFFDRPDPIASPADISEPFASPANPVLAQP